MTGNNKARVATAYDRDNVPLECKRDAKKELAKIYAQKQWLLDNKKILWDMDMYSKYFEFLGRAEDDIMNLEAEVREEKKRKKGKKK